MDESVRVPVSEFQALEKQAAEVPALEERERRLRELMGNRAPVHRPKRALTPQEKVVHAKKKAVRNAQREARRMNRKRR